MSSTRTMIHGPAALEASEAQVRTALGAARVPPSALVEATAMRMVAAATLAPAPRDPVEHLRHAHVAARRHLERLGAHAPDIEVTSTMTAWLYAQLTRTAASASQTSWAPTGAARRYTYTPRKVLRRVLDHALDHLNQIDQWSMWRREGVTPTPTDGWASSTVTLAEDRLPLSDADLDAWLWRIDQAARLITQRAAALDDAELDWHPPDGGWPLRRVLHHVARSEMAYASALDNALPDDADLRYAEATRRLVERVRAAQERAADDSIVYVNGYGAPYTPDGIVEEVLRIEHRLAVGT